MPVDPNHRRQTEAALRDEFNRDRAPARIRELRGEGLDEDAAERAVEAEAERWAEAEYERRHDEGEYDGPGEE